MSTHEWKGRIECAWHKQNFGHELIIRDVPGPVSHSICADCAKIERAKSRQAIAKRMEVLIDKKPTQENQSKESA